MYANTERFIIKALYNKGADKMETYRLHNGLEIPVLGFGTWQLPDGEEAYQAVAHALKVGYNHIDTAQIYGNEVSVGQAIKDSAIQREELFLTTKVWNDKHAYDLAKDSIQESMAKLQVDYLDLVLIHWPNPKNLRENQAWKTANAECWRAMEELYQAGKIRAIGVSNFMIHHLETLFETAQIKPMVNQILLAPGTSQEELVDFCRHHEILLEAYSPLGTGTIFENQDLINLGEKYGKSVAQIALRWSLQKGFLPLPKSVTPAYIEANLQVFDFELSDEDIEIIDQVQGVKTQNNPDEVDF